MRKFKKVSVKLIASLIAVIILISPINVLAAVMLRKSMNYYIVTNISVTAKIYTHMVDKVFEQNRKRLAEYANQKEQKTQLA